MIQIDGNSLTITEIHKVAVDQEKVILSPKITKKIRESRHWVEGIISQGEPVYGINTGYGIFADKQISSDETQITKPQPDLESCSRDQEIRSLQK